MRMTQTEWAAYVAAHGGLRDDIMNASPQIGERVYWLLILGDGTVGYSRNSAGGGDDVLWYLCTATKFFSVLKKVIDDFFERAYRDAAIQKIRDMYTAHGWRLTARNIND